MTDLLLIGFRGLSRKKLVQLLSEEKKRMFADQKLSPKRKGTHPSASSVWSLRGGKKCLNPKK